MLLIVSIVFIVLALIVQALPIGARQVKCPHCGNATTVKGDGIYRCPFCQNEYSFGKTTKTAVSCPYCKKVTHVDGPGIYVCPICNDYFSYGIINKTSVQCPHCQKHMFIDGEGVYSCPWCDNMLSFGKYTGVVLKCQNCKKTIIVEPLKEFCPKCFAKIEVKQGESHSHNQQEANTTGHYSTQENTIIINKIKAYLDELNCSGATSFNEIRHQYIEMIKKYHPDTLLYKDIPEEIVKMSENKLKQINEAYDFLSQNKSSISFRKYV
jgi:Zn finger protein HypA/HybF involved in hydrogenase expression